MNKAEQYTIGRLAEAAGIPVSSVRFYERCGLLDPDQRSESNYRLYGRDALDRLRFIKTAQAAGFTLKDAGVLLGFRDGNAAPCSRVQELIERRLAAVEEQAEHLAHAHEVLVRWLSVCRDAARTGHCGVLEGLAAAGEGDRMGRVPKSSKKTDKPLDPAPKCNADTSYMTTERPARRTRKETSP